MTPTHTDIFPLFSLTTRNEQGMKHRNPGSKERETTLMLLFLEQDKDRLQTNEEENIREEVLLTRLRRRQSIFEPFSCSSSTHVLMAGKNIIRERHSCLFLPHPLIELPFNFTSGKQTKEGKNKRKESLDRENNTKVFHRYRYKDKSVSLECNRQEK